MCLCLAFASVPRWALSQTWGQDPTFGTAGLALVGDPSVNELPQRLLIDSQGRIVVAGFRTSNAIGTVSAVWRLLPSGVPDPSFGIGGRFDGPAAQVADAVIEPNDDVVLLLRQGNGALCRVTSAGQLDTSFGSAGTAPVPPIGGFGNSVYSLARRSDGVLFVGGNNQTGAFFTQLSVVSFTSTGVVDATFGSGGVSLLTGEVWPAAMTFDGGNLVLAGMQRAWLSSSMYVAGITLTGTLAWELGIGFGTTYDRAFAIAMDSSSRICCGGNCESLSSNALVRLSAPALPDPSFGVLGKVTTVGSPAVNRIRFAPNGDWLVTGGGGFGVLRYTSAGQVDTTWGAQGTLSTADTVANQDFAFLPEGSVVVTGSRHNGNDHDLAMVRYALLPGSATFAPGCPSSGGANVLSVTAPPRANTNFVATGTGLPTSAFVLIVTGFTGFVPGFSLDAVFAEGVPGCEANVMPDIVSGALTTTGTVQSVLFLPNTPPIVGVVFYHQMIPLELAVGGGIASITSTSGLRLTVGM